MKPLYILLMVVGLGGGGYYFWTESQAEEKATAVAVKEIAALVAYEEVYASGRERASNETCRRLLAVLIDSELEGVDHDEVHRRVEWQLQLPIEYSDLLHERLMSNLALAFSFGLDTRENMDLMRAGKAPTVTKGKWQGQKIEIDHIVPKALAPDLDNLLINLEPMPESLNREKSDSVDDNVLALAKRFYEAGIMMPQSWERVSAAAN